MNGISIMKPGQGPQIGAKSKIREIPQFKGRGKALPGPPGAKLGPGLGRGGLGKLGMPGVGALKLGNGGGLGPPNM